MDTREKLTSMLDALLGHEVIRMAEDGMSVEEIAEWFTPYGKRTEGYLLQTAGAVREILRRADVFGKNDEAQEG